MSYELVFVTVRVLQSLNPLPRLRRRPWPPTEGEMPRTLYVRLSGPYMQTTSHLVFIRRFGGEVRDGAEAPSTHTKSSQTKHEKERGPPAIKCADGTVVEKHASSARNDSLL